MVKKRITDLGLLVLLCSSGIRAVTDETSFFGVSDGATGDGSGQREFVMAAKPSDETSKFAALSDANSSNSKKEDDVRSELVGAAKDVINVTESTLAHCLHVMEAAAQDYKPELEKVLTDLKERFDADMSDVAQVVAADLAAAKIKVGHVKTQIATYADVTNRQVVCDRIETNLRSESARLHGALADAAPEAADALRVQTRKVDDLLVEFVANKSAIVGQVQNGSNLLNPTTWGKAAYLGAGVLLASGGYALGHFTK